MGIIQNMGCHASKNNTNYRASLYKQEQAIHINGPQAPLSPAGKLMAKTTTYIHTGSRKFSNLSATGRTINSQNSTSDSQGNSGGKSKISSDFSNMKNTKFPLSTGQIKRVQKASTVLIKDPANKNIFNTSESDDDNESDIQETLNGEYI